MVCPVVARTAAARRNDTCASSSGAQNSGSAHRPTSPAARLTSIPVAAIAEPIPNSERSSSSSAAGNRSPLRARRSTAASTASQSAASAATAVRNAPYAGPSAENRSTTPLL